MASNRLGVFCLNLFALSDSSPLHFAASKANAGLICVMFEAALIMSSHSAIVFSSLPSRRNFRLSLKKFFFDFKLSAATAANAELSNYREYVTKSIMPC
jgi:hypothetical protein